MVEVNPKRTTRKRVRRVSKELDLGVSRHVWNCLVVAVVGTIAVAFLLVQRHEERVAEGEDLRRQGAVIRVLEEKKTFLIYGTAWKEEKTAKHVKDAIHAGFRFVDTAAQPKHYHEEGVGDGWTKAAAELDLDRSDFFLQTKYSPYQEKGNCPYDTEASLTSQVIQSVQSSLKNLQTDYIDSLVLHSPLHSMEQTFEVWQAMEALVDDGTVKRLGVSNCYGVKQFQEIYEMARIKPWALQNRFYADSHFDTKLRRYCKEKDILYQSFWTLTANRKALKQPEVIEMAKERDLTPQTLLYAFLMSLGYVTPLSGTTSLKHMGQDARVMERIQQGEVLFETEEDLRKMAKLLGMPDL